MFDDELYTLLFIIFWFLTMVIVGVVANKDDPTILENNCLVYENKIYCEVQNEDVE